MASQPSESEFPESGAERTTGSLIVVEFGRAPVPPPSERSPRDRATGLFIEGPAAGSLFTLSPGTSCVIGRGSKADVRVPEDTLSREHAQVFWDADGREPGYAIEDLGAPAGTWVDRARVRRVTRLRSGQRVHLGPRVSFRFELCDEPEQAAMVGLQEAAMTDPLTGAFTRRYLNGRLRAELSYAQRHELSAAVLMLDLDHFKRINDAHGHAAGDAVLRIVAAQLMRLLRPEDVLVRYGGEEFCVLLRRLDLENARILADRLRRAIAALQIPWGDEPIRLTVSGGVATAHRDETPQALLERADRALYESKRAGRNRVTCDRDRAPLR